MKTQLVLFVFLGLFLASCSKTDTSTPKDIGNTIVTSDSSQFNGRLFVYTYDFNNGSKITGADVFLYTNYEDIKRHIYLFYQKSNTSNAMCDFGYLMQGNYYIVSSNFNKTDTSLVQVLSKRVVNREVYLK